LFASTEMFVLTSAFLSVMLSEIQHKHVHQTMTNHEWSLWENWPHWLQ